MKQAKSIISCMLTLLPNAFNPESQHTPAAATIPSDESEVDDTEIVPMPQKKYMKDNEPDLEMVSMATSISV
jgi:hypothetical protein